MYYTVSDFYNNFKSKVTLLAGKGGLSRQVSCAGILDYELDPTLKNKYFHSNFHENQFVLTTFLYAKDNAFLIGDAVKHLAAKGASGLAIKNVFHLHIHDSVLRYADSKNFPIFIIESDTVYFEDVIFKINSQANQYQSLDFFRRELDVLLSNELSEEQITANASNLNPSFEGQHFAIIASFDEFLSGQQFDEYRERYLKSSLNQVSSLFTMYRNSLLFICSKDNETPIDTRTAAENFCRQILQGDPTPAIGVSGLHYHLGDFKQTITESLHAALFAKASPGTIQYYEDLGVFKILLPFAETKEMSTFSYNIMEKLIEYDAENNGRLAETLAAFCSSGSSISAAAKALNQHENTIRYRMDKVKEATGLNYKKTAELEQLSLAYKIYHCHQLLNRKSELLNGF